VRCRGTVTELDLSGVTSEFQQDVYRHLLEVPHGHVTSYGKIASEMGHADQARAVGQAVGANPIPILIPCHRVIGSDGKLTGFSGGLPAKVSLLRLEGVDVDGTEASSRVHPEVIPLDL
jgi:methylated-DNA-[protein]-cysteine S-methyltransferase